MSARGPTLVAASLAALTSLTACGSSPQGVATHIQTDTATSSGTSTAATATSASAPAPTSAAVGRCHTAQLQIAPAGGQGAAGTIYAAFGVRNSGTQPCTVFGYPGVLMLDGQGRPLPTSTVRSGTVQDSNAQPTSVLLPPGTAALGSGNRSGHASFTLRWGDTCSQDAGNSPAQWQFIPPDETASIRVSATSSGFGSGPVCGTISVFLLQSSQ